MAETLRGLYQVLKSLEVSDPNRGHILRAIGEFKHSQNVTVELDKYRECDESDLQVIKRLSAHVKT